MRTIVAYSILVYIFSTLFGVTTKGIAAFRNGTSVPFLIVIPGTLAMLISLLFISDTIHFKLLKLNPVKTFVVSLSLYVLSLILLLFGNLLTDQVNTYSILPNYLIYFSIFPFLILIARYFAKPVDPVNK